MEKKPRTLVPDELAAIVLFKAHRTCCVCRAEGKPVQLHHIDDDPSNNVEENIAVLCLYCHNDTLLRGGFGRKLDAAQVRLYKTQWEVEVASGRTPEVGKGASRSSTALGFHVRAYWIDLFIVGGVDRSMSRKINVIITNRGKETRFIESFGFRIDSPGTEARYVELHPVLSLAQFNKRMESGEQQSFSVSLANLKSGPAHDGLKEGEALSAFVCDTLGETCYSAWLRYEAE